MNDSAKSRNPWITRFILFLILAFFLTVKPSLHQTTVFAQDVITPTIYCVGGSGVPPCAAFPSTGVSTAVSPSLATSQTPSTGVSTAPGASTAPSAGATSPVPSVAPCSGTTSTFSNNSKRHHKWRRGNSGGGFFERFFAWLIKLIQQLLGGSGGQIPGFPTPCPSPSTEPSVAPSNSPSNSPATSTAPSIAPSTTVSGTPSTSTAPSQPAGTGSSPSGEAMPTTSPSGWKLIFSDDFTQNIAIGGWPGPYASKWTDYADGTPDTAGKNNGSPSEYYPSKVVSASGGLLDLYLHSEGGKSMAAALLPNSGNGQTYGKYTIRFKSDSLQGFKTAWLLWPDSENWPQDGEIDFPEGDLSSTIGGFMHRQGGTSGSDQDAFSSNTTYTSWHTADMEWAPNSLKLSLDGKVIGTSTSRVPNTSMHYVMQTESCLTGCPSSSTAGHLQVDWFVMYAKQ